MNIRFAKIKDLNQLRKLTNELETARVRLHSKKSKAFHKKTRKTNNISNKDFKSGIFLVAEDQDKIVGFAWGKIYKRKNHALSRLGYIYEAFVDAKFRGKGIGKLLLAGLVKEFKKRKCDHIITHTDWENKPAQKLYTSFGMNETTIELWKKI